MTYLDADVGVIIELLVLENPNPLSSILSQPVDEPLVVTLVGLDG